MCIKLGEKYNQVSTKSERTSSRGVDREASIEFEALVGPRSNRDPHRTECLRQPKDTSAPKYHLAKKRTYEVENETKTLDA